MKRDGKFLELIRSEDLINILWMTNPNANVEEISEIGLTQLVSLTINNSLPNAYVLKELDENIQKYAIGQIEAADCIRLASNVASQTVLNMHSIEALNKLAKESPVKFVGKLQEYMNKAKLEEKAKTYAANVLIEGLKSDFERQLKETEDKLKRLYNSKISEGEKSVAEKEKMLFQMNDNRIKHKRESYIKFTEIKETLDKKAKRISYLTLWKIIILYIVEFVILVVCTFIFGWPKVAPFAYFIGSVSSIIGYGYFAFTEKELNPVEIYKNSIDGNKVKIYKESGFDIAYFSALKKEIEDIDKDKKLENLEI
jgi:ABC-type multidrug transport system fused ATPase/permease subunit